MTLQNTGTNIRFFLEEMLLSFDFLIYLTLFGHGYATFYQKCHEK